MIKLGAFPPKLRVRQWDVLSLSLSTFNIVLQLLARQKKDIKEFK